MNYRDHWTRFKWLKAELLLTTFYDFLALHFKKSRFLKSEKKRKIRILEQWSLRCASCGLPSVTSVQRSLVILIEWDTWTSEMEASKNCCGVLLSMVLTAPWMTVLGPRILCDNIISPWRTCSTIHGSMWLTNIGALVKRSKRPSYKPTRTLPSIEVRPPAYVTMLRCSGLRRCRCPRPRNAARHPQQSMYTVNILHCPQQRTEPLPPVTIIGRRKTSWKCDTWFLRYASGQSR